LLIGRVNLLPRKAQRLGDAQIGAQDIHVVDRKNLATRIEMLRPSGNVRVRIGRDGWIVLIVVLQRQRVLGGSIPIQIGNRLIAEEVGSSGQRNVVGVRDRCHACRIGNQPTARFAGKGGRVHQFIGNAAAGVDRVVVELTCGKRRAERATVIGLCRVGL